MSAARICGLIAGFTLVALAVVHVRGEQMGCSARLLKLESRQLDLRRDWWALQAKAARLRSPERIHARIAGLRMNLISPGDEHFQKKPAVRLASGRR